MAGECTFPGADAPIVRGLLGVVDCNVQTLVHDSYATLFAPSGAVAGVLTILLAICVALVGYQLMLGRGQLRVGDVALNAVKLGAVLALATQWDAYEAVVYNFLFNGPRELAGDLLRAFHPRTSAFNGDVFDGLQQAFDDLAGFANGYMLHAPAGVSPLLGGAGYGAVILTLAGTTLLLSTLGVILAAKIVLALLLALGPVFIVCFLFDATRGLFEGWLRASIAFAFAPLASIVLLGVLLTMLEPALLQIAALQGRGVYTLGPVYGVVILILVFVGVTAGALIAAGMIAAGFRLPRPRTLSLETAQSGGTLRPAPDRDQAAPSRATRTAAALERRDAAVFGAAGGTFERRVISGALSQDRRTAAEAAAAPARLGQGPRRPGSPRDGRPGRGRASLESVR
jgi:type IV secretion system protein VirB6